MSRSDDFCKIMLAVTRKELGAKPEERIDKRYYTTVSNGEREYLAPDNLYYRSHCGYCAEVKYLEHIYNDRVLDDRITSVDHQVVNVPANFKDMPSENLFILANNLGVIWQKNENAGINRMRCIMALKEVSKGYELPFNTPMNLPEVVMDQAKVFVGKERNIKVYGKLYSGIIQWDTEHNEFYVIYNGKKTYVRPHILDYKDKEIMDLWTIDRF